MPLSARVDHRTSRPSSASRSGTGASRGGGANGSTPSATGRGAQTTATTSTPNIGSSENIKNIYEQRGRSERPTAAAKTTPKPPSTIKPKQTTTSLVRQKVF